MTLVGGAGEGGGFATSAKLKLDELFVTWLSYSDTCQFISSVISSFKLSPSISPSSPPHDSSPILDGSVISPRKFSPRKYNRSYTRNPPDVSLSPNNNNNNNKTIHAELDLNTLSPPLETKRNKTTTTTTTITSSYETIPRFYFPPSSQQGSYPAIIADDIAIPKIISSFSSSRVISFQDALAVFESITPGLPQVVCKYMLDKEGDTRITEETITRLYKTYISGRDAASVIFEVLKQQQQPADNKTTTTTTTTTLQASDFRPFVRLIIDSHPGLSFLNNTPEFQERYLETILVRIFYNAPRGIIGKMNLGQLRKSGIVSSLLFIENENDINKSIELFSYEHFYVIYCKFWEVDTDHDLIISAEDLMRYSGGAPTRRVAERIATVPIFPRDPDLARVVASKMRRVRSNNSSNNNKKEKEREKGLMTYQDFVWFILSEEDRETNAALEYWFRILDLDEDGCWSSFELEYFYTDMMPYLRELGMDAPPFSDLLCQWLDMLSPSHAEFTTAWDCPRVQISMADLKKSKLAKSIIHSLVSPSKFLSFETKDPFAEPRDGVSDWVRFALVEYELAVADQADQHHHSDDDT